uniref:Uncharacterized protein n=1 Tax=Ditylenchus dipsaci TaxID=166011 RepID=A0A915DE48_9BILA
MRPEEKAERLRLDGNHAYNKGNYEQAIQFYKLRFLFLKLTNSSVESIRSDSDSLSLTSSDSSIEEHEPEDEIFDPPIQLEWVTTQRGNKKAIFEGEFFTIDGQSRDGTYIFGRCDHRFTANPEEIVTAGFGYTKVATFFLKEFNFTTTRQNLIEQTLQDLQNTNANFSAKTWTRAVYREKKRILHLPANPTGLVFNIPRSLIYFNGPGEQELFVLGDTRDNERVILLGRQSTRNWISTVTHISGDGTFAASPSIFVQEFQKIVHVMSENDVPDIHL